MGGSSQFFTVLLGLGEPDGRDQATGRRYSRQHPGQRRQQHHQQQQQHQGQASRHHGKGNHKNELQIILINILLNNINFFFIQGTSRKGFGRCRLSCLCAEG